MWYGFRPPVGQQEVQTVRGALLQPCLQSVVARVIAVSDVIDPLRQTEVVKRTAWVVIAGPGHGLIPVFVGKQMAAHVADVGELQREVRRELVLHRYVPEV